MPESQFDQVQGRDHWRVPSGTPSAPRAASARVRRERRRLCERAFPGDERDRVVEVQRVKAEWDVRRAALPVPCVEAGAGSAKVPWHQIAVPGAERQRDVAMGPSIRSAACSRADRTAGSTLRPEFLSWTPSHHGLAASSKSGPTASSLISLSDPTSGSSLPMPSPRMSRGSGPVMRRSRPRQLERPRSGGTPKRRLVFHAGLKGGCLAADRLARPVIPAHLDIAERHPVSVEDL